MGGIGGLEADLKRRAGNEVKAYIADTGSSLFFSNLIFAPIEYILADYEWDEFVDTRIGMSLVGLVSYRLGGKARDIASSLFRVTPESSSRKKWISDTTANIVYNGSIYTAVSRYAGVEWDEWAIAFGSGVAMAMVLARLHGKFQDGCRKFLGVKPALD